MSEILEQIEEPQIKLLSHALQVGAPAGPAGLELNSEFEVTGTKWHRESEESEWKSEPHKYSKKVKITISDKEMEAIFLQFKEGVIDYEAWRIETIRKTIIYTNCPKCNRRASRAAVRRQYRVIDKAAKSDD